MDNNMSMIKPYNVMDTAITLIPQHILNEIEHMFEMKYRNIFHHEVQLIQDRYNHNFMKEMNVIKNQMRDIKDDLVLCQIKHLIRSAYRWHTDYLISMARYDITGILYVYNERDNLNVCYYNKKSCLEMSFKIKLNINGVVEYQYENKVIIAIDVITKGIMAFDRKQIKRSKVFFKDMKLHCPVCDKCSKYIFTCGHFICGACLSEMESRDNFKCPTCNAKREVIEMFSNK